MTAFGVLLLSWALTGGGAVVGSILGNALGPTWLKTGAVVGGMWGLVLALELATRFRWLPPGERRGAMFGGGVGFVVAALIAATNLHTPVTPVLATALVGVGVLLGAGIARGWQRTA